MYSSVPKVGVSTLGNEDNLLIVETMLLRTWNLPCTQVKSSSLGELILFSVKVPYWTTSMTTLLCVPPSFRTSVPLRLTSSRAAGNTTFLMKNIPDHRGPDALRPPDKLLRGEALDFCAPNYDQIFMHNEFGNA
ncbi:hypothetical protein D6C92_10094 [Aureobasidium pullulans]|nr:hypothetical protein D6C92_10094 [Aureobasidium pullulans]